MINQETETSASAAIAQIEALAGAPLGEAERTFLNARPDLCPLLAGTLELVRREFPSEKVRIALLSDQEEPTESLFVEIWLPPGATVASGEKRYDQFGEHWVESPFFASSALGVCLRYAD